jgi:hypothetical protein
VSPTTTRRLIGAIALSAALAGCSSSSGSPGAARNTAPGTTTSTATANPAQGYLDAVDALCDALLPKIVAVTHGGSIDVPAHEYLATWPAHKHLLDGFDAHVARIPVPPTAAGPASALSAYMRFADRLDAARLAAAHKGQAAYADEVNSESGVENAPAITALANAGSTNSCTAR